MKNSRQAKSRFWGDIQFPGLETYGFLAVESKDGTWPTLISQWRAHCRERGTICRAILFEEDSAQIHAYYPPDQSLLARSESLSVGGTGRFVGAGELVLYGITSVEMHHALRVLEDLFEEASGRLGAKRVPSPESQRPGLQSTSEEVTDDATLVAVALEQSFPNLTRTPVVKTSTTYEGELIGIHHHRLSALPPGLVEAWLRESGRKRIIAQDLRSTNFFLVDEDYAVPAIRLTAPATFHDMSLIWLTYPNEEFVSGLVLLERKRGKWTLVEISHDRDWLETLIA